MDIGALDRGKGNGLDGKDRDKDGKGKLDAIWKALCYCHPLNVVCMRHFG